jgi:YVTN family beta-propeller protein
MRVVFCLLLLLLGPVSRGSSFDPPVLTPTAATFSVIATRVIADPVRPRVYAAIPQSNTIAVINTQSLATEKSITVGAKPHGLAFSVDGSKLYVANSGDQSISVISLVSLSEMTRLSIVRNPYEIAAGAGNRLYVTPAEPTDGQPDYYAMQLDATTGAFQAALQASGAAGNGAVQVSSDGNTLYLYTEYSADRYDISTATAVRTYVGLSGGRLSHDGRFFCSSTAEIPVDNLGTIAGSFLTGEYERLGPVSAFGPDDKVFFVYNYVGQDYYGYPDASIAMFSTTNFRHLGSLRIEDLEYDYRGLADWTTDSSGKYLFVPDHNKIRVYDVSPQLVGAATVEGYSAEPLNYRPELTFDSTNFSASDLPAGWTIDPVTGVLNVASAETGDYTVKLSASAGAATAAKDVTFHLAPREVRGRQLPTPTPVPAAATFAIAANRLLPDPSRPRIYASIPATNTIAVLRTDTRTLEKSIFVGSDPQGMAISPDGHKLFVANRGGQNIGVVDLDALIALPRLDIPLRSIDLASGMSNRLYVAAAALATEATPQSPALFEADSTSGAVQAVLNSGTAVADGLVQLCPDRLTLFFRGGSYDSFGLFKFDVAVATPHLLQKQTNNITQGYVDLDLSHDGTLLFANGFKVATADLNTITGSATGIEPIGPSAFNLDDTVAFETDGDFGIAAFSIATGARIDTIHVSHVYNLNRNLPQLVTDGTGRYLVSSDNSAVRFYDLSPRLEAADGPFVCSVGDPFTYRPLRNFDATTFSAETLPPGLVLDSKTGVISGTPNNPGRFTASMFASRGTAQASQQYAFVVYPHSRLLNISTRGWCPAYGSIIAGFIVAGNAPKEVATRGLGPGIPPTGLLATISDPVLEFYNAVGNQTGYNTDHANDPAGEAELSRYGIVPNDPREAAIVTTVPAGLYTVVERNQMQSYGGTALPELYDLTRTGSRILNISTRGYVSAHTSYMIGGFILGGPEPIRILVRALGPSLTSGGVGNPLADPKVELHDAQGALISSNDNWKDAQRTEIEATGIPPANDLESAILVDLPAGAYTAVVTPASYSGEGLVEVYDILP